MRNTLLLSSILWIALGCVPQEGSTSHANLNHLDDPAGPSDPGDPADASPTAPDCSQDRDQTAVQFECDCVRVWACRDLSNVVIESESGERERFEGLSGYEAVFCAEGGEAITTAWIKAGANHSGDGPGYGERHDAEGDTCSPSEPEPEPEPQPEEPQPSDDAGVAPPPADAGYDLI